MKLYDILTSSFSHIALSGHGAKTYLIPEIPRKTLVRAWRAFCLREKQENVLALIDTSFFKNGKEGFLFTKDALYIKEPMRRVHKFRYDEICAIIYFQALSTYTGKSSVSMEIDTRKVDFKVNEQLIKNINSNALNEMLQEIVAIYRPDERKEIQKELKDSENQIAHPEHFKPHKFKNGDPQIYNK